MQQSAGWYWQTDSRYRVTHQFGSAAARCALGKPPWEVPGVDTRHPGWQMLFDALMSRQSFTDLAWRRCDAQGRWHLARVSGEPQFGAKGRFLGFRGFGHLEDTGS
jgi:hypothetical protein